MGDPADDEQPAGEQQHRVGAGDPAAEVEREGAERRADRPHDDALQAVGAAGQPVELVGELVQDQGDAERDHQAGQVGAAQDEKAGQEAEQRRRADRGGHAEPGIGRQQLGAQGRAVRAEAEERGVAERHDAGVAEDQVEREREQREDRDLVEDEGLPRKEQPGRRQRREGRELPRQRQRASLASAADAGSLTAPRPRGRTGPAGGPAGSAIISA